MQRLQKNLSLLTLLPFSAFIITLYALSAGTVSSLFVQPVNEGESGLAWMYGFVTSKNDDSATAGNSYLTDGATLSSTAEFLGDQIGTCLGAEWAVLGPQPILAINKEDNPPDNVQCGAVLTYTITYSNIGSAHATEVIILDTFDSNVTFEESWPSPTGGAGNVRYWQIGKLHKRDHGNITTTVTVSTFVDSGEVLTNLVQIDSPDAEMASDIATTTVVCPILTINKDDDPPDKVQPGAVLTYTVTYSNVGNANATGVIITDTFDNRVTFGRSWPSPTGGAGNVRYWQIGKLHKRDHGNITIIVTVSTSIDSDTVLTNLAQIDSPDAEMASSTETTTVVAGNRRLYLPIVAKCWDIPPCEDPHEPNNAGCSAYPISSSTCIASYICCPLDLKDYYYIEITTLNTINIDLTSLPADYDLYLYDSPTAWSPVAISDSYGLESEHITYNPTHTGRYYIRVHPFVDGVCSNTDSYQLCVSFH